MTKTFFIIISSAVALFLLVVIAWAIVNPHLEIKGNVAYKMLVIDSHTKSLEAVAMKSAENTYMIAEKHKKVNKVVIALYLKEWYSKGSGWGMRNWNEKLFTGDLIVENMSEARQYKNVQEYITAKYEFYKREISKIDSNHYFLNVDGK